MISRALSLPGCARGGGQHGRRHAVWTFRADAPDVVACWLRADLAEVTAHDAGTALLCWLIYRGTGVPYTVTKEAA